jgi:hypothetical protein
MRRVLGGINALAIAPDGTWFASAHGATVAIWDVAGSAARLRIEPPLPPFEGIGRLAVSPDSAASPWSPPAES